MIISSMVIGGDTYGAITGVVEYSYSEFKILPRVAVDICTADCDNDPFCGDGICNGNETAGSCPEDCGGCSVSLGDVNGDGGWNVLDVVTLANCVLGNNCEDL